MHLRFCADSEYVLHVGIHCNGAKCTGNKHHIGYRHSVVMQRTCVFVSHSLLELFKFVLGQIFSITTVHVRPNSSNL